jgi:SDR family mycofactocin-dependent oxidoreductase
MSTAEGRMAGKVAVVTGAARGAGRTHAVRLGAEGAAVIALDLCGGVEGMAYRQATSADLEETARQVEAAGGRVVTGVADIRDGEGLRAAVDAGVAELGRLDLVAANAGIVHLPAPAIETDPDRWQAMLDTNLTGAWNTCRATVPHIQAGGRGGSIVFTSSVAALTGYPGVAAYVSSKHGLVGLTRALAVELGPDRIRVNHVAPTQISTDMIHNEAIYKLFVPDAENPTREEFAAASEALHLLPTPWVEPEDVTAAVLFLLSDEARYITASTLSVDAGAVQH